MEKDDFGEWKDEFDAWADGNETGREDGYREGYAKGEADTFEKVATENMAFDTGHRMGYEEGWKAAMEHIRGICKQPPAWNDDVIWAHRAKEVQDG